MTRTTIGPLKYMSPEAIANRVYSTQSDVWSFGIVVWEILVTLSKSSHLFQTREAPHEDLDMHTAAYRIMEEGIRPPIPSEAPEHIQLLLKDCWQLSPSQRPSFEQICVGIQRSMKESRIAEEKRNSLISSDSPIPPGYARFKR